MMMFPARLAVSAHLDQMLLVLGMHLHDDHQISLYENALEATNLQMQLWLHTLQSCCQLVHPGEWTLHANLSGINEVDG